MDLKQHIRTVPDFPEKGIMFRDVTTLFNNAEAFAEMINQFQSSWAPTISDATGLEAFINLTNLNLRGNVLTDIDLTSLVNLEVLNLNDNFDSKKDMKGTYP